MPKAMEAALEKSAKKKFGTTKSNKAKAYIYGTMREKTNWTPSTQRSGGIRYYSA